MALSCMIILTKSSKQFLNSVQHTRMQGLITAQILKPEGASRECAFFCIAQTLSSSTPTISRTSLARHLELDSATAKDQLLIIDILVTRNKTPPRHLKPLI